MRIIAAAFLAIGLTMHAAAPVPRPAPELSINDAYGKPITKVSALKGKVVVLQFLFTYCGHCQNTATWLSKMKTDLPGVEIYGVAVNDEVNTTDPKKNAAEVAKFGAYGKFPVGIAKNDALLKYMGFSIMDRWGVPQLIVIDKKGVIRAQTSPSPTATEVVSEPVMRALITKLMAEK